MYDPISIIAFCLAIIVAVALILLFKKRVIDADVIEGTGEIMDAIPIPEGCGAFGLIASYAKTAVHAVEQLVKNGVIKRDDQIRKDRAMTIVECAAKVDGIAFGAQEQDMASYCIEAEVQQLPRNQKPPDAEAEEEAATEALTETAEEAEG